MVTVSPVAGGEQQQLLEGICGASCKSGKLGSVCSRTSLIDPAEDSQQQLARYKAVAWRISSFTILPLNATAGGEQQQPPQENLSGASTEGGPGSIQSQSSPLSSGAKAGIGAGVAVAVVALLSLLVFAAVKVSSLQAPAEIQLSSCGT